ncbi:MAG: hypothetical protein K2L62_04500, partial [Muribaculaceae bacterium]|nr:hypothetical protein [Muribaculaceae bacterium]
LIAMHSGAHYILVTDSPYFFISLTMMVLGTQLFLTGFLGELIVRNSPRRNEYEIECETGADRPDKTNATPSV